MREDKHSLRVKGELQTYRRTYSLLADLMAELMEMNTVKYSAYRLALKLRRVQQRLCLDLLDLEAAVLGFDMHGLTPDRHDMAIEIPEMVLILYSIYETLDQEEPEEIEVSVAA